LGDSHGNFQLQRFSPSENIAKSFKGATFLTHTMLCYETLSWKVCVARWSGRVQRSDRQVAFRASSAARCGDSRSCSVAASQV